MVVEQNDTSLYFLAFHTRSLCFYGPIAINESYEGRCGQSDWDRSVRLLCNPSLLRCQCHGPSSSETATVYDNSRSVHLPITGLRLARPSTQNPD